MDDIWIRYPNILATVLGYLDNKSLSNCRQVNKIWKNCIANNKIIWHRIITKNLVLESNIDSWKHILYKIPLDIIKEIGESWLEFQIDAKRYRDYYIYIVHSPLYTAAGLGLIKPLKYIIEKTKEYNPDNGKECLRLSEHSRALSLLERSFDKTG